MTSTELEIQGEFVDTQLTKAKARALDKKVRTARNKVIGSGEKLVNDVEALYELVAEAAKGQIHKGLDTTWAAWFKDAAKLPKLEAPKRKEIATFMAGKTLSVRMIAGVVGASHTTIERDLAEAEVSGTYVPPETVDGLDGRTTVRSKATNETIVDAEYEDLEDEEIEDEAAAEESPTAPATAAELVTDFDDEFINLWNALAQMVDILAEPKWSGAKKRIVKAHLNELGDCKTMLDKIVDELMAE